MTTSRYVSEPPCFGYLGRVDLIRTKEAGINSLTERIVADVWAATDMRRSEQRLRAIGRISI